MYKPVIALFLMSALLLFIGYTYVFNTRKTVTKMTSLANYKEDSFMYKMITSNSNIMWAKIGGIGFIVMALMLLSLAIFVLLDKSTR